VLFTIVMILYSTKAKLSREFPMEKDGPMLTGRESKVLGKKV